MLQRDEQERELLDLVHSALKQWKAAEMRAERKGDIYLLRSRSSIRAAALKGIYLELLREARKKQLSLTTEQLLERVLYPCCKQEAE